MDPVLIFTDTQKINTEKALLNKLVPIYQAVYDALKGMGVTATLAELGNLTNWKLKGTTHDYVNDYVRNKLLDQLAPYQINGVTMTREFFLNNIEMPDTAPVTAALAPMAGVTNSSVGGVRKNLLALAADVISKVVDSDAQITTAYTYYTQTDATAQLATDLQAVCDALNTFDDTNNDAMKIAAVGKGYKNVGISSGETMMPGIEVISEEFVVSLKYIQQKER
jgi:hypothetical protein